MTKNIENANVDINSLEKFVTEMMDENKKQLNKIEEQKRLYLDELAEKEAIIASIKKEKEKENNSGLFFPNSKDINTEEYENELKNINEKINSTNKEKDEKENNIKCLQTIMKMLENKKNPQVNMGLNILELQEQDRQRIARDLHDSTVQNLTGLIHKCELSSRFVDIDPVRAKLELTAISNTLKSVINEIRETIFNLKPMTLEDLGLIITIERFINQLMSNHDVIIKFIHNEEKENILPVINLSIFRIVQESCNNAIKHANAKCIDVNLQYGEKDINVTIKDDGKGFDVDKLKDRYLKDYSGCGLSIMKERVYLMGGTLDIKSEINKGTTIVVSVPYCKAKGKINEQTN